MLPLIILVVKVLIPGLLFSHYLPNKLLLSFGIVFWSIMPQCLYYQPNMVCGRAIGTDGTTSYGFVVTLTSPNIYYTNVPNTQIQGLKATGYSYQIDIATLISPTTTNSKRR
jgi:hypothetical protein